MQHHLKVDFKKEKKSEKKEKGKRQQASEGAGLGVVNSTGTGQLSFEIRLAKQMFLFSSCPALFPIQRN